ncbi:MAG: glycosyltransferase [Solirubrobacteraceae bacterium]
MNLDSPLPPSLSIGAGTALFVCGTCFDPERRIRRLKFVVDGEEQDVTADGMPRLDHFRALHPALDPFQTTGLESDPLSADDPGLHSYRSGFWGLARISRPPRGGILELLLRAEFETGATETRPLGAIQITEPPEPVQSTHWPAPHLPNVAICLATYNPPLDLLSRQLDSIRAQDHANWVCLISDDCSDPERFEAIRELLGDDRRFVLSRSPRRLGFYLNFERALAMAPADADFVALSDQDDYWYPDKLQTLLETIGPAQLVYSDARIVNGAGKEIAPTYWGARSNNHQDLLPLLVANSVTGAASLLRREVLEVALPFPPGQFAHFHDHWIALIALAVGGIEFVPRPLYDYVQHGGAALGHAQATRVVTLRQRLDRLRGDLRERIRAYRSRYFVDVMRLMAFATILDMRCGSRMTEPQRRDLRQFLDLETSPAALTRLSWRAAHELAARQPETLGAEWALLQSLVWRMLLRGTATERPGTRLRLDAVPPPDLAPQPGRQVVPDAEGPRLLWEKTAPLELAVSDEAPQRVNILIPTIDLEHFFGGYIAKFNLARRLAERGIRVRLLTVDPVGSLPSAWRAPVESYSGLTGLFEEIEVAFGREASPLEVSRRDAFVATTWWTAHVARAALKELGGEGFVYLIQEYEPMTFPMGSYAALAAETYRAPHFGLFSSELLRDYFRRHGIGVYEQGKRSGDAVSAAFENAITQIAPPRVQDLAGRQMRRLLFYARPEPHAARNMFELGILALHRAAGQGAFAEGWELRGIGSIGTGRRVRLPGAADLELVPRAAQDDYARVLSEHDVGLALMYTPHPSLVPIEMASAGLLTVTNTFENKTAEALAPISSNLIAGEPTVEGISDALVCAVEGSGDFESRVRGAAVSWSRDWNTSFDDALLARLESYLVR